MMISMSVVIVFVCFQVDIYAGSVFLYEAVGWNVYISAACILVITAVYTLLGKLLCHYNIKNNARPKLLSPLPQNM